MSDDAFRDLIQKQSPTQADIQQFKQQLPDDDAQFLQYLFEQGPVDETEIVNNLPFIRETDQAREYIQYYQPLLTTRGAQGRQQISIDPQKADFLSSLIE